MLDNVKATITKEVVLAYPDLMKPFEMYTDASMMQLGAVITQGNRPIVFFSIKFSKAHTKYSLTKFRLLAMCVFLASGYRWATVMHEIPISRAHMLTSLLFPRAQ